MGTRKAQQCPPRSFGKSVEVYFSMCRATFLKIQHSCKFQKRYIIKIPLRNSDSVKSVMDWEKLLEQIAREYQCCGF